MVFPPLALWPGVRGLTSTRYGTHGLTGGLFGGNSWQELDVWGFLKDFNDVYIYSYIVTYIFMDLFFQIMLMLWWSLPLKSLLKCQTTGQWFHNLFFTSKAGPIDPHANGGGLSFFKAMDLEMGVSKNSGTPKSSISIGFSIISDPFGVPLFLETPKFMAGFYSKKHVPMNVHA